MRTINSQFIYRLIGLAIVIQSVLGAELSRGQLLQAAGKPVTALSFSQDDELLASGSQDGTVSTWAIHKFFASPRIVTSGTAASSSGRLLHTSETRGGNVAAVAFSPSGSFLATGGQDGNVRIWTIGGQEIHKLAGHTNGVSALTFSPDGQTLVSGGADGSVFLWNTRDWTLTHRLIGHPTCVHALRVSANNQYLASGSDEFLRVWNLKEAGYPFDTLREPVRALSYYGLNVASAGDQNPRFQSSDGKGLRLWQPSGVIGSQILAPWVSQLGIIFSLSKDEPSAVATEESLMATGWPNGAVEIRDADELRTVKLSAHATAVVSVALSPGGMDLATGSEDGTIKLWPARRLLDKASPASFGKTVGGTNQAFGPGR